MKGYLLGLGVLGASLGLLWWGYNPSHGEEGHEHHHHHDHDHDHDHDDAHAISDEALKEAKIEFKKAEPHELTLTLKKGGWVQINPDKIAHLTAPYESRAVEIYKKAGDRVEKDDILALLYSPTLSEKKRGLNSSIETKNNAEIEFKRAEELYNLGLATKQELESKATAYRQALLDSEHAQNLIGNLNTVENQYQLKAPFSGTIIERHLVNGEWVNSNETLFILADLKELKVEFPLFPSETGQVKNHAKIRLNDKESRLEGVLPHIENELALKGFALVKNDDGRLYPGSYVNLDIVTSELYAPIAVEHEAVYEMDGKPHVFIKKEGGFEAREIEIGSQDDQYIEVISGLEPNEVYCSKNAFRIKADMGKEEVEHEH